ncbi:hypothetical protein BSKO_06621 [Bryopsis sp. KO-2023]|nr:hypothetical protein BSKO_06621 [Bryopsis sp. KO-2023]
MKRIHKLASSLAVFLTVWSLALSQMTGFSRVAVGMVPLLGIVGLGAYMLAALIYGVATFRTVPEECDSLMKDVAEARADLISRGVLEET